jgi:hypothetical protein
MGPVKGIKGFLPEDCQHDDPVIVGDHTIHCLEVILDTEKGVQLFWEIILEWGKSVLDDNEGQEDSVTYPC